MTGLFFAKILDGAQNLHGDHPDCGVGSVGGEVVDGLEGAEVESTVGLV